MTAIKNNMVPIAIMTIAALCLAASSAVDAGQAAQAVLYPQGGTVTGSRISVVLEPAVERMPGRFFQLTVNGERGPIMNGAIMPHAVQNISLLPGENRITVTFFEQQLLSGRLKKVGSQELPVFSVQTLQAADTIPRDYRRTRFHESGRETACRECHDIGSQARNGSPITSPGKVCLSCHSFVTASRHVHSPVEAGSCAGCHEERGNQPPAMLAAAGKIADQQGQTLLCGRCHARTLSDAFTHGPTAAGLCTYCHDPHSGPHAAQLRKPVAELCMGCHEARSLETCAARTSNVGGERADCTVCHDPHGSGNNKLLLTRVVIREDARSNGE